MEFLFINSNGYFNRFMLILLLLFLKVYQVLKETMGFQEGMDSKVKEDLPGNLEVEDLRA